VNQQDSPLRRKPGTLTFVGLGVGVMCIPVFAMVLSSRLDAFLNQNQDHSGLNWGLSWGFIAFVTGVAVFSLIFSIGYKMRELKDKLQQLETKVNSIAEQLGQRLPLS
jgi:Ni/Fe-hydrogenase subunit HybB-like protein